MGGMMHITLNPFDFENGYAGLIFARFTDIWIFGDWIGAGLRNNFTALTLQGLQLLVWNSAMWGAVP